MKLKQYIEKIKILENEIKGCYNLIEFYTKKVEQLKIELENLKELELNINDTTGKMG